MAKNMAKKAIGEFNPSVIPAWVSEGSLRKYDRAVKQLRDRNALLRAQKQEEVPLTEADIKELYVKWNGLVLDKEDQEEAAESAE